MLFTDQGLALACARAEQLNPHDTEYGVYLTQIERQVLRILGLAMLSCAASKC